MQHHTISRSFRARTLSVIAWGLASAMLVAPAQGGVTPPPYVSAALRTLPGVAKIRVYEVTGTPVVTDFAVNDPRLSAQLPTITPQNRDLQGMATEYYDLFYSNPAAVLDPNGNCLTIKSNASYFVPGMMGYPAGAHNIAQVELLAPDNRVMGIFNAVSAFTPSSISYDVGSEDLVVDGNPATFSRLGWEDENATVMSMTLCRKIAGVPGVGPRSGGTRGIGRSGAKPAPTN